MSEWTELEPLLRERAYRTLDSDPQVLFEHDGGPDYLDADVFLARLIGLDDEIVEDGMRLRRLESVILLPIHRGFSLFDDGPAEPTLRTAEYVLQSGWAILSVALPYPIPPGVEPRPDGTVRVAFLRYRRRRI